MSALVTSNGVLISLGAPVSQQISPASISSECWPALVELSVQQGLGPMLAWVLKQNQFFLSDESLNETLRQVTKSSTLRWLLLQEAQHRLHTKFAADNIRAIWLKGIVLANSIYPNPPLRPMSDIDVLMPYEQRHRAVTAARQLGYRQADASEILLPADLMHHYVLVGPSKSAMTIEIHSRLLGVGGKNSLLPAEQMEWFVQPEQLIQTRQGYTTLKSEPHLLYLCAHALLQHSETPLYLQRFFDLHQLITHSTLDWEAVIARASALRWSLAVERALVLTSTYFSTSVPGHIIPQLRLAARATEAKSMRKINTSGTDWDTTKYWLRQLRPGERISAIRSVILPSPAYMRRHYGLGEEHKVWLYYPIRWLSQGRRVARSLTSRLHRSSP